MKNQKTIRSGIVKRVVIEVDKNGLVWVDAFAMSSPLAVNPLPMDSREMVLLLHKVVIDYTNALFQGKGTVITDADEQQERPKSNNDPNVQ